MLETLVVVAALNIPCETGMCETPALTISVKIARKALQVEPVRTTASFITEKKFARKATVKVVQTSRKKFIRRILLPKRCQ